MTQDNQKQAVLYAYLAGILDGEGTIRICRSKLANKKFKNHNLKYAAHMGIGMVSKNVLELFQKVFGANVRMERVLKGRQQIYRWGTSGNIGVPIILEKLLPYLMVKRKQAELVIKFCREKQSGFERNNGLPILELQRREEAYQAVRKLNAVGAAATK
jgi:hypothetical protein